MLERWMQLAIEEARRGMDEGQSPFGAAVVRGGELVAVAHNVVIQKQDATRHAEMEVISKASAVLGTFDLSGCEIFSTCEPCPMCASAIHWARFDAVYFGAAIEAPKRAGFNELNVPIAELYRIGSSTVRIVSYLLRAECEALFDEWATRTDRVAY